MPPLSDRATGALVAALTSAPDRARELLARIPEIAAEAAAALAALEAMPPGRRADWLEEARARLGAGAELGPHPSWIDASRADPSLRLPAGGPLLAPLAGVAPGELVAVVRALGACRVAVAVLPGGTRALTRAIAGLPEEDGRLVARAAAAGAGGVPRGDGAREAIDEVRSVLGGSPPAMGALAVIGVRRLARILAGRPAAIERAAFALPRELGEALLVAVPAAAGETTARDEIAVALALARGESVPAAPTTA